MLARVLLICCFASVAVALAACTSVRLDQPAPPASAPKVADAERYPPPRVREPPAQPIESPPIPLPPPARAEAITPPTPAAATPLPTPLPPAPSPSPPAAPTPSMPPTAAASIEPAPVPAARPAATPVPSAAASAATAASPAAASASASLPPPLAPGRWSVQAGVFMVEQNAQALRARLEPRLAAASLAADDRALRIARRDGRLHVVIGDRSDRAGAIRLAAQLREALQQDVTLFAW